MSQCKNGKCPKVRPIPMKSGGHAQMHNGEGWPGNQHVTLMRVKLRNYANRRWTYVYHEPKEESTDDLYIDLGGEG